MHIRACIHVHMSGTCVRRQEVERQGENTSRKVEKWKVTETDRGTARQKADGGSGRGNGGAEEEVESSG